jgi:hypothetical protein
MIPPLDNGVMKYIHAFDIASVCVDRDGRVRVTRDPQGAAQAYWLPADHAGLLVKTARTMGDIPAAAQRLGLKVTDHHTMVVRARAAVDRLDARLSQAKADGALKAFPNTGHVALPRARLASLS